MLKEVVSLLSLFSPRLCRLIGQVWELASLNVFVLLQVANTALQEAQQLRDQLVFSERFNTESSHRQTILVQRYEDELTRQRVSDQALRAELQKVRQRANRLAVENGQLHLVVSRVLDTQAAMDATRYDSSNPAEQLITQDSNFCEDIAAVGDVEERELYGVGDGDEDVLARIETVHPIESYATDFEQLFQTLFKGEERNTRLLNEMDRFINSTAVALLWRYGSTEEEHQMMHRMLSTSTESTQTDGTLLVKPSRPTNARSGEQWESESEDNTSDDEEGHSQGLTQTRSSPGEAEDKDNLSPQTATKHEILAVIKQQILPPTLRTQLDSRPRVQRVLEKSQLNRILLRLYLEKLECDARTLRRRRIVSARVRSGADPNAADEGAVSLAVVRTPLHRFMKEFFLARYEVPELADFHMMEIVKSCFYYHEQLKITLRRGAVFGSAPLVGCLPENLLQHHQLNDHQLSDLQHQQQYVASDIRVELFSRLCELVPFDSRADSVDSAAVGGNLSACLLNAVVDVLGDVLELDPAVVSLAAVEEVPSEANWGFPRELALELLTRHLPFIDQELVEDTKAHVDQLAPVLRSPSTEDAGSADCIAVDVFLALFATTWIQYDHQLENKLRESFRRQLLLSSPFARKQLADAKTAADIANTETGEALQQDGEVVAGNFNRKHTRRTIALVPTVAVGATAIALHSSPIELFTHVWLTLENETLSSLDVEELERTFRGLAKLLDSKHIHRRQSIRKPFKDVETDSAISLGGVTEKEFVFHTLQVLRRRRNNHGLRTNSRRPPRTAVYGSHLHESLGPTDSDEISIPLDSLKPGLNNESLAYVSK
ncbi:hypothetical protein P3T76_002542 [Phytophthora citrophthora]|uniref:Uncharacterized protein n=1 Tax=Phytophthora citrophthora TaxID=4793 RepID=A0AAD9GUW9_9STRA|nr:hypothetical protein P3T76_002542 [Phytophthora citrophthora]